MCIKSALYMMEFVPSDNLEVMESGKVHLLSYSLILITHSRVPICCKKYDAQEKI